MTETALIVGQGYVGLPLAMRAVQAGYDVIGYDVDEHRSKALAAGSSFVEDITDADVAAALATGRYRPARLTADGATSPPPAPGPSSTPIDPPRAPSARK